MNTASFQGYVNILNEGSVTLLLNSYRDLNLNVVHAATKNRYVGCNDI